MGHAHAAGLVGGLLLSLVWMLVLRYSAGLLAWLVVLVVTFLFVACTLLAFTKVRTLVVGTSPQQAVYASVARKSALTVSVNLYQSALKLCG